MLNMSTEDALLRKKLDVIRTKVINNVNIYFHFTQKEGAKLKCLNCIIIQFKSYMHMDQICHIMKMTDACFKKVKYSSKDTPSRTNHKV